MNLQEMEQVFSQTEDAPDAFERANFLRTLPRDKNRHNARSYDQRHLPTKFIGVDGEGIDLPEREGIDSDHGRQAYVLLSVGDQSLHNNGKELKRIEIFEFLWEQYLANKRAAFVGYFLNYDFTHWLKSLPEYKAWRLYSKAGEDARKREKSPLPYPVDCGDWEFDLMRGDKRFRLHPKGDTVNGWLWICDAGPFFQTSFIKAIDPKNWDRPIVTDEEFAIIKEGKARRSVAQFDEDMIRYNVTENLALAKLMATLESGFRSFNIKLYKNQWFGPGQAAQKWLNQIKAPDKYDAKALPEPVKQAAIASYYGGWFEIAAHGHIPGTIWEYDINSAYPYVTSTLPCLRKDHGIWTTGLGEPPKNGRYTLCYVTVKGNEKSGFWGTVPCRTSDGKILRPFNVRGWYWKHELHAFMDGGFIKKIKWHQWFQYEQTCDESPFRKIADLYNLRLSVGKKTPMGQALKLVYNSVYGKEAQSVGNPRFANPVYASLIPAGCRAIIARAMGSHPDGYDECVMVATDAVYFTSPHPGLRCNDQLGSWDVTEHQNMTLMMPGVYWDDTVREAIAKNEEGGKIKSRGVRAVDLRNVVTEIDDLWSMFPHERTGITHPSWPFTTVPISFSMVSGRLAVHRNDWASAGRVTYASCKFLNADPSDKRDPNRLARGDDDIWWTIPYDYSPDGLDTVPYEERFGLTLEVSNLLDGITEDGHVMDEFYEAISDD